MYKYSFQPGSSRDVREPESQEEAGSNISTLRNQEIQKSDSSTKQ